MYQLKSFIISLFAIFISMFTSIIVMIKGWGVNPQSWVWIIFVYLVGTTLSAILILISKD